MSAADTFMARALREYGEAILDYAKDMTPHNYQRMLTAQGYLWECAKDVAAERV